MNTTKINEFLIFPELKSIIENRTNRLDIDAIEAICNEEDSRLLSIITRNLAEFTTYDFMIYIFYHETYIKGSDLDFITDFLVYIGLLRVSYHLGHHHGIAGNMSVGGKKIIDLSERLEQYSISQLLKIVPNEVLLHEFEQLKSSYGIYERIILKSRIDERWTVEKWKQYVSLYPDSRIMLFACLVLCSTIKNIKVENMRNALQRNVVEHLTNIFLSANELENWKENVLKRQIGPISSLVYCNFCGKVKYEDILKYVYHCKEMRFLIAQLEDEILYLPNNVPSITGVSKKTVKYMVIRGKRVLDRTREMQSVINTL